MNEAADALRRGELVLLNTDSLPGLHALATDPAAPGRLAALKGSPPGRPFLLLFASTEAALGVGACADPADEARLRAAWPGPLTALLRPREGCPPHWVEPSKGTVAIRVPAPPALREFLGQLPGPLFSTSANRAGQDPATRLGAASQVFPDLVAADLGLEPVGQASTLVDLSQPGGAVLRPGPVAWPPAVPPA